MLPARLLRGRLRVLGPIVMLPLLGCGPGGWGGGDAVRVEPPRSWKRVEATRWRVPGVAIAAWSGPENSSLVVYRTLPVPDGAAAMIADALVNRMEHLPGVEIRERRTEPVAGRTAARVELTAPGTGDALAPSGAGEFVVPEGQKPVSTRQVTIGFVRPDQTLYLRWHAPEASYDRIAGDVRSTLESLRLDPGEPSPPVK